MAAPSIVQKKVVRTTSAVASLAGSFDATPGVGRLIVAFAYSNKNVSSCADNQSNTYTDRDNAGYDAAWGRMYTAPATTSSGTFTVTMTPATSGICTLVLFEVANWNNTTLFEQVGHKWELGGESAGYQPFAWTGTTTNAELLFLCAISGQPAFTRTYSAASGWTQEFQYTANDSQVLCAISKSVTSTGVYNPTWDLEAGSIEKVALGISLIGGTQGPPGSSLQIHQLRRGAPRGIARGMQ